MSDLRNQTPSTTYKGLLQVNDYSNGVDATSKFVQDGEGTNSALSISTTKVGVGTSTPLAPLDVTSTTGGVVFPRLSTAQRDAISSPTDGETIFNTTTNQLESYNGSEWVAGGTTVVATDGVTTDSITDDAVTTAKIANDAVTSAKISDSDTTFKVAASEVAVNDGGADVDFRVEGDTDANLISTNAVQDTVGIGSVGSSTYKLNVNGGTAKANIANFQADNAASSVAAFIRNTSVTGISSILQLVANTASALTSSVNLDLTSNVGVNEFFQIAFGNGDNSGFRFANSNTGSQSTATGAFYPATNGSQDLGLTGARWDDVWSNGTFNGSDQNLKQDIEDLNDAEKKVAAKCKGLIKKYRMKDAVVKKGNDARIHVGIIAQELQAAFESEGLDAFRYSMLGKDTWWEKIDENGQRLVNYEETPGYTEVTQMSVRYNELLAFIIAAM